MELTVCGLTDELLTPPLIPEGLLTIEKYAYSPSPPQISEGKPGHFLLQLLFEVVVPGV
jgi:hypothetical protein